MSSQSSLPRRSHDFAEQVALVARAHRRALLRSHRHRLRADDLEDCFSQATLELLAAVAGGRRFTGRAHLANALAQRFSSRVDDRRRALNGRSALAAALERALPLGLNTERAHQIVDRGADIHPHIVRRFELERLLALTAELSADQRLVLAHQLANVTRADFCDRFGWTPAKYRKVAHRARARLRLLCEQDTSLSHLGVRSRNRQTGMHL